MSVKLLLLKLAGHAKKRGRAGNADVRRTLTRVLADARFYATVHGRRERFDPARTSAGKLAALATTAARGYLKADDPDGIHLREDIQAAFSELVHVGVLLEDHAAALAAIAADHIRARSSSAPEPAQRKPSRAAMLQWASAKGSAAAKDIAPRYDDDDWSPAEVGLRALDDAPFFELIEADVNKTGGKLQEDLILAFVEAYERGLAARK